MNKTYMVKYTDDYNGQEYDIIFVTDNHPWYYYDAQLRKGHHSKIKIYEIKEIKR